MSSPQDIYDPAYVKGVFDKCSDTYITMSYLFSFGFTERWRRQCVKAIPQQSAPHLTCYDFMSGTGEVWPWLFKAYGNSIKIAAVDISDGMHNRALARITAKNKLAPDADISFVRDDIFNTSLPAASADIVVATFGLKTFNAAQQKDLAALIKHVLKPGGAFSLIEASDPKGWLLRPLYRFHLTKVLPLIETLVLKGAQDFSMIGQYTEQFEDCSHFATQLRVQGLTVTEGRYMFGCATGVSGLKPS